MEKNSKVVDGFRFLPPKLSAWIKSFIANEEFNREIPFHPLAKPLSETRLALVTSAGISLQTDPPFDMEREKVEPTWGDPSYRAIPKGTVAADIEVNGKDFIILGERNPLVHLFTISPNQLIQDFQFWPDICRQFDDVLNQVGYPIPSLAN